ncbi:STAS domain-containing protein [Streptomyces sp. NPDC014864]|uniref:STAS domain-containing protein n=1 Tax=Streptomyces sp. NPDC014864 TaxID=3364924 RepID=UPI0036F84D1D
MTNRVPVLKIGDILLVSIQTDLEDQMVMDLQDDLSRRIVDTGAKGVVIDISALEIVDSFVGRMLATNASISRLLGAETIVVGMRPAVAMTLVELGLSLKGVRTALNLERGLWLLRRLTADTAGSA